MDDPSCSIEMEEKRVPSESAKSLLNLAAAAEVEAESVSNAPEDEMEKLAPGVRGRGWFDRTDANMSPKINVNSFSGERSLTVGQFQLLRADAASQRKASGSGGSSNKSNKSTPKGRRRRRDKEEEKGVGCPKTRSFKGSEQHKVEEYSRGMYYASKSAEVDEGAEVDMEKYLFRVLRAPYQRRRSRASSPGSPTKEK